MANKIFEQIKKHPLRDALMSGAVAQDQTGDLPDYIGTLLT